MTIKDAKKIISDNSNYEKDSFVCYLYEEGYFSIEKFWEYYDSIAALIGEKEKDAETTRKITQSYQNILKEFIWHFDPNDIADIKNLPENYTDFIERLDFALTAYYTNNTNLIDDDLFELKK